MRGWNRLSQLMAAVCLIAPCGQLVHAQEVTDPPRSGTPILSTSSEIDEIVASNYMLKMEALILSREFEGEKMIDEKGIMAVIPFSITTLQGDEVSAIDYMDVRPRFWDKAGHDLKLWTVVGYSSSLDHRVIRAGVTQEQLSEPIYLGLQFRQIEFPRVELSAQMADSSK